MGRGKDVAVEKRLQILHDLDAYVDRRTGKLEYGALEAVHKRHGDVSVDFIRKFFARWKRLSGDLSDANSLQSGRKGHCGRASKLTKELRNVYQEILQDYATRWTHLSVRRLKNELQARNVHLGLATVHEHLKAMNVRETNIRIEPQLEPKHMRDRVQFILDQVDKPRGAECPIAHFKDQLDLVHVSESWFYLQKVDNKVLVMEGIEVPDCPWTIHKSRVEKVMFLVAMARPRVLPDGTHFDGKIGMWPCVECIPARSNTKNGLVSTMEVKSRNVDAQFYADLFTREGGVLQRARERMHFLADKTLRIQREGARAHQRAGLVQELEASGSVDGWTIKVITQPARSPDLNVLDLGFFDMLRRRVDSLQPAAHDFPKLVATAQEAFQLYNADALDRVWGRLYACWNEILKAKGSSQYRLPQSGECKRKRGGASSVSTIIDIEAYDSANEHASEACSVME